MAGRERVRAGVAALRFAAADMATRRAEPKAVRAPTLPAAVTIGLGDDVRDVGALMGLG